MKQRIRTAESKVNKMSQASPAPLVKNQNSTKKVRSKKSMTAKIIILIVILSTLSALPAFALVSARAFKLSLSPSGDREILALYSLILASTSLVKLSLFLRYFS